MTDKHFGVDVSHHQHPASLPWATFAQTSSFAIARGSYGQMKDRVTAEHVRRARAVGLKVGLYHFFRPSQPAEAQLAVFRAQLAAANIGPGDIVPALDVEADPLPKHADVSPAWQDGVRHILDELVAEYGDALVYITQREFGMLGKPAWLLDRPLWVAHYTSAPAPATPGGKVATIWQHRVAPYDPNGVGGYDAKAPVLDQNRLLGTLPLIGAVKSAVPAAPVAESTDDDAGLEDIVDELRAKHWERIEAAVRRGGEALREHESIEERAPRDTDISDLAPESEGRS